MPVPAKPTPGPAPASQSPLSRRSAGLRSGIGSSTALPAHGDAAIICFASSLSHCATGFDLQEGTFAATTSVAASRNRLQLTIRFTSKSLARNSAGSPYPGDAKLLWNLYKVPANLRRSSFRTHRSPIRVTSALGMSKKSRRACVAADKTSGSERASG